MNEDELELPQTGLGKRMFIQYVVLKAHAFDGPVAQLVRASPCHGEGRRFESDLGRLFL